MLLFQIRFFPMQGTVCLQIALGFYFPNLQWGVGVGVGGTFLPALARKTGGRTNWLS